jgi:hypothetical protein
MSRVWLFIGLFSYQRATLYGPKQRLLIKFSAHPYSSCLPLRTCSQTIQNLVIDCLFLSLRNVLVFCTLRTFLMKVKSSASYSEDRGIDS